MHLPDSMFRFGLASSFNTERCKFHNLRQRYWERIVRGKILKYGHAMYIATDRPLARILLLLLLYKKVLDILFPTVATTHLIGLNNIP